MIHVLIVEDHAADRKLLKRRLERSGYRVTTVGDGLEALAAARLDRPDAIVSDVLMPKMDGFALCRAWVHDVEFKTIPFIFYSATYARAEDEQFGIALGAVRYLVKPLEEEAFLRELRTVLQEWAGHAAPALASPLDDATTEALHESALARKLSDKTAQLEAANRMLLEGGEKFRGIYDNLQDVYVEATLEGTILEMSDQIETLSRGQYKREDLIGTSVNVLYADPQFRQAILLAMKEQGRAIDMESVFINRDGSFIPCSISATVVRGADGKLKSVGTLRDISKRKQAASALQESEAQLKGILESSPDGILAVDGNGKVIRANHRFAELWHIPKPMLDTAEDKVLLDFVLSQLNDPDAFIKQVRALYASDAEAMDMLTFKDGRVFERRSSPLKSKGANLGRVWSFRDITERIRSKQQLVDSEAQFRGLVEQSIAGIYIIQDGKIVYVNQRGAEILGRPAPSELIGGNVMREGIVEADRVKITKQMQQLLSGEMKNTAFEFGFLRPDGTTVEIGAHGALATFAGQPAIIGLVQDISEKKRTEQEILRYIRQLEASLMSTVEVATTLSEMRDPYTTGHERRVAEIAVAIGAELGFDSRRQEGLRIAGHLHDVGKMTIPAEILAKPGKLSAIEFQLVHGHAQASFDVLKGVEFSWPVAQIALQHHERMDGSGYPQGLKGEAILLEARIMAVADVVEAMSSHRPYRPGLGIEKALAEIEHGRGTAYDADVADACLRLFRERRYQLPV